MIKDGWESFESTEQTRRPWTIKTDKNFELVHVAVNKNCKTTIKELAGD